MSYVCKNIKNYRDKDNKNINFAIATLKMRFLSLFLLLFFASMQTSMGIITPAAKREVRAVWLTTLGGLDWPHTKAYNATTIQQQKDELSAQLDLLQKANFNVVFLQTRVRSTVIYPSAIEPWDACLTGHLNKSPNYDPLAFAIDECHKRGMQLHAWVVAFPGHNFRNANLLGRSAMQKRVPSLCIKTSEFWMLNPGMPGTADYLADICAEIVQNYDVDGIHLDYIRYPEQSIRFNDNQTYRKYGHGMRLSDWRRQNVTQVVKTIHTAIKNIKPWVWLSCSPVGKHDNLPNQSSYGWNAYSTVYQDAQGWLKEGIMDMLVPMMYFQAGRNFYPFALDWKESSYGRPIVNGLAAYKLDSREGNWNLETIEKEIRFSRAIQSGGQAFFRSKFIIENYKSAYKLLQHDIYALPALTPAMTWLNRAAPPKPQNLRFVSTPNGHELVWDSIAAEEGNPVEYNIYFDNHFPVDIENPLHFVKIRHKRNSYPIKLNITEGLLPYYAITAIDRYGNESEPAYLNTPPVSTIKESHILNGNITINDTGTLNIPPNTARFIYITDELGQEVMTLPYQQTLDLSCLPPGTYTIYGLKKKGKYNVFGTYLKR